MKKQHTVNPSDSSIYTLVQSGTTQSVQGQGQPLIMVSGRGTDLSNKKGIQSRAKRKMITQKTILSLIDIATAKGAKDRVKAYWNTYHCQSRIYSANGKLYGNYCKNRFCTLCSGIRKAELINKYLPVIAEWQTPYFVTLTVKSVKANRLHTIIKGIIKAFRIIRTKYKKRSQRGKAVKLMGLKTLECNFNPKNKTYNPHLHLIVPSKEVADILINEWLTIWTKNFTHRDAQHYRKVEDKEEDLVEVIKYGSKIFTEPDTKRKSGKTTKAEIYAAALDNIYYAMKGCRIFERFGFNLQKASKKERVGSQFLNEYQEWHYDPRSRDWITSEHESTLTGYAPPPQLVDLLEFDIDTLLE